MNNSKLLVLEGNPIPLARSRFNKNTLHLYDSQRTERVHTRLMLEYLWGDSPPLTGNLYLDVAFHLPIPKSLSIKVQRSLVATPHSKKPDASNLLKWVEDIGNGIAWHDDAMFVDIRVKKVYSLEPKTVFVVGVLR